MHPHKEIINFIVQTYFNGSNNAAAEMTRYTVQQITVWRNPQGGTPQVATLQRFIEATTLPKFSIIAEYSPLHVPLQNGGNWNLNGRLAEIFDGHGDAYGIYGFYDSLARLIYVGMSEANLRQECYQRLNANFPDHIPFPGGFGRPQTVCDATLYISAYAVKGPMHIRYARHPESLILRLSKPLLNRNIGALAQAIQNQ